MGIDKEKYLKNPAVCPFCKAENIERWDCWSEGTTAHQASECLVCQREWYDTFKLVDIREVEIEEE